LKDFIIKEQQRIEKNVLEDYLFLKKYFCHLIDKEEIINFLSKKNFGLIDMMDIYFDEILVSKINSLDEIEKMKIKKEENNFLKCEVKKEGQNSHRKVKKKLKLTYYNPS